MQVIHSLEQWRLLRAHFPSQAKVGFVPTMGNLHQGHMSLCARSLAENELTVVSLFVNPTQFNQADDFAHYPRTVEADLQLLQELGVHYCLLPEESALYSDNYRYQVSEIRDTLLREGASRPGHFTGVLTVVMKLFQLVQPQRAYFGEKDHQQCELIEGMVEAFFIPIQVVRCPTIREASGLAFSSRNNRLSPTERQKAEQFARLFSQKHALEDLTVALTQEGIEVIYLEEDTTRRYIAVKIGAVRLIDNRAIATLIS